MESSHRQLFCIHFKVGCRKPEQSPAEQRDQLVPRLAPPRRPVEQVHAFRIGLRFAGHAVGVGLARAGFAHQLVVFQQLRARLVRVADVEFEQSSGTLGRHRAV